MGNASSLSNQIQRCDLMNEGCSLGKCVNNVQGMEANSISPTDIWFVSLGPVVMYEGENVGGKDAVMKVFLSTRSRGGLNQMINRNDIAAIYALNYEHSIYQYAIQMVVKSGVCVNFIDFIGGSEDCSYHNMMNMLGPRQFNWDDFPEPGITAEDAFLRNMAINVGMADKVSVRNSNRKRRPSLNTPPTHAYMRNNVNHSFRDWFNDRDHVNPRFGYLITKRVDPRTITLTDYMSRARSADVNSYQTWAILFQIAVACYAMSMLKLVHNDLHSSNVLLEPTATPNQRVTYLIDGQLFTFYTSFKVRIFDFDRSYRVANGRNNYLEITDLSSYSQTNVFIPNKDIVKLLGHLDILWARSPTVAKGIENYENMIKFITASSNVETIKGIWREGMDLRHPSINPGVVVGVPLEPLFYQTHIYPMSEIVKNFGAVVSVPSTDDDLSKQNFDDGNIWGIIDTNNLIRANGDVHRNTTHNDLISGNLYSLDETQYAVDLLDTLGVTRSVKNVFRHLEYVVPPDMFDIIGYTRDPPTGMMSPISGGGIVNPHQSPPPLFPPPPHASQQFFTPIGSSPIAQSSNTRGSGSGTRVARRRRSPMRFSTTV